MFRGKEIMMMLAFEALENDIQVSIFRLLGIKISSKLYPTRSRYQIQIWKFESQRFC